MSFPKISIKEKKAEKRFDAKECRWREAVRFPGLKLIENRK